MSFPVAAERLVNRLDDQKVKACMELGDRLDNIKGSVADLRERFAFLEKSLNNNRMIFPVAGKLLMISMMNCWKKGEYKYIRLEYCLGDITKSVTV